MTRKVAFILILSFLIYNASLSQLLADQNNKPAGEESKWVERTLKSLSLRERIGQMWQRYDIGTNLLSLELPGAPKKLDVPQLDNLPPDVRSNITLMELHQSQYNDFVVTVGVIGYTDKIQYDNQRGITSMLAELQKRPEVTDVDYHTSPIGDSMLSVMGTMKVYGNLTVINGFVENHNRKAYTVLTFYLQTNKDAPTAAQRVFQSINLK